MRRCCSIIASSHFSRKDRLLDLSPAIKTILRVWHDNSRLRRGVKLYELAMQREVKRHFMARIVVKSIRRAASLVTYSEKKNCYAAPSPSGRHHPSYDHCLEDKRANYHVCSVLYCCCVVCFCCVRFSFVDTAPRDWLRRTFPK